MATLAQFPEQFLRNLLARHLLAIETKNPCKFLRSAQYKWNFAFYPT